MKGLLLTLFLGSTANEMTGSGTKIGSWNRIEYNYEKGDDVRK